MDGQDISAMKHMEAVNVLRATKQHVKLVVLRRPTGVSCHIHIYTFPNDVIACCLFVNDYCANVVNIIEH